MKMKVIGIVALFLLQCIGLVYGEVERGCTHKLIYPEGFISIGEAEPYQPPIRPEHLIIPEPVKGDWFLMDSLDVSRYVQAGKNFTVYFDNDADTLEVYPSDYNYPLTTQSRQAIEKAPEWLRNDLIAVLSNITSFYQDIWAYGIISAEDPYVDEIAFSIAHSSPEYLMSGYGSPGLFQENAETIYYNASYLDYVEIVDYGTSGTDGNYYSTTKYWKKDSLGNIVQVEVPKDIYYWYLVHPKITDEIPAYIDPDIIESNSTHNNNIAPPPVGVFWRDFLFNHADTGYPMLRDMLENCPIVWDYQGVAGENSAVAIITSWIQASMQFTSNYERPHQPVRIYRKHIGRCGEHADITAAATRACLIPCTSILSISGDHTWNEFWDEEWIHWEPVNNYVNNPLVYENGWGKVFGSVFEIRSDGYITSVTNVYSEGSATITIYALDNQGNPIDGGSVLLAVKELSGSNIYIDNYGITDNEGKCVFIVGEGRTYYARIDTDIGSYPSTPNQVVQVCAYSANGGTYTYSLYVSGTMPSLAWSTVSVPQDTTDDYRLDIDFTAPMQIVSGTIWMDDVSNESQLYKKEDNGIIDYFMTDETNYLSYLNGNPFDCFNRFSAVAQAQVTFDIPDNGNWYCVFGNNRHLKNFQNVCGSVKLYSSGTTQEFELSNNWNWISFNVHPDDTSIGSVFSELGDNIYQVKNQTQSATYYSGAGWVGDLTNITDGEAYLVNMVNPADFSIFGMPIDVSTSIPVTVNWNWIAYFPQVSMDVATALSSIEPNAYQVKNQTQSATYFGGNWIGDLTIMEPGVGYKLNMTMADELIYPSN